MTNNWLEDQPFIFTINDYIKNQHMHYAVLIMMKNDPTLFVSKCKTNPKKIINPHRVRMKHRLRRAPIEIIIE